MYLTPEKYRTMGFGIDLEGIEDVELAAIMSRASAVVDSYCAVPRLPVPHSFLGGVISTTKPEQHFWRLPEHDFDLGSRRVYPNHWPVKTMTQFRIKVTNTQYVTIQPTELFINNTERYVEVVSLMFTGLGLFGAIIPTLSMMKPICEIAYEYGETFDETEEVLYATDARTYRAANQFWTGTPVVYSNGNTVSTSDYTVDSTEGTIVFTAARAANVAISVDYTHRLPWEIRDATAMIATHLLGEREQQARGMTGVKTLKVAEVTITNNTDSRGSKENMSTYIEPEVAWLLDGFKYMTVR